MMYGSKRVAVRDLNPHILCALCGGYLIQATTVIECLHSFCRSCIVNFLETSKVCPICDAQIHKTRPLLNIRPDQTLQSLVYKLVPGLFQDEMRRRREFHSTLSESDVEDLSLEERGEASLEKEFKPGDDHVSLVLQLAFRENKTRPFEIRDRRYLLCPSEVTVKHLKKFIRIKFQLNETHKIEMYRAREELSDDLMLQDIALIYSWRREQPMNLCYLISESRRSKSEGGRQQLVSKQSDLCCTVNESPTAKSTEPNPIPRTVSTLPSMSVSLKTDADTDLLSPVSKCSVSESRSAPGTPLLTTDLSSTHVSPATSSASNPTTVPELLPSACQGVDKVVSRHPKSSALVATDASAINNINVTKPAVTSSASSQPKTAASARIVSPVVKTISASKTKPIAVKHDVKCNVMHDVALNVKHNVKQDATLDVKHNVKQDATLDVKHNVKHDATPDVKHNVKQDATPDDKHNVKLDVKRNVTLEVKHNIKHNGKHDVKHNVKHDASKLMHSVESILNKTPKRAIHKTSSSAVSWSPVPEPHPPSPGSLCKEKSEKTNNNTSSHCQREPQLSQGQRQTSNSAVSKSSECGGQAVVGIKRSRSVIETVSCVAEVCGQALTPQEVVGINHSSTGVGLLQPENGADVFSTYIPKLQKHLKMCAVKRSASYEGPSLTPAPGAVTCVDAMEKRNWKKRKLSTLDFDVSKVTIADSHVSGACNLSPGFMGDSRSSSNQHEETRSQDQTTSHRLPELAGTSPTIIQPTGHPKSSLNRSSLSPLRDQSTTHSVSYLPFVLPQAGTTASLSVKSQSQHSTPDSKVKSISRKSNGAQAAISSSTSKTNNKVSCGNKLKDLEKSNKIDKIKIVSNKKQLCVFGSHGVTTNSCVDNSLGYTHNKSGNSRSVISLVEVSTNGSYVEEICVDTSSSPSDVSSVTSPTTYVTSPGTEDRTDSSTLPDIQTSCDTNCGVTFSGKVVPLDLSVKKK